MAYSYQMKQLYVGTASNNILAFPIEDILNMKVSDFNSGSVKELGKEPMQKKLEKGKSVQIIEKEIIPHEDEEEKIGSDSDISDDSA